MIARRNIKRILLTLALGVPLVVAARYAYVYVYVYSERYLEDVVVEGGFAFSNRQDAAFRERGRSIEINVDESVGDTIMNSPSQSAMSPARL